MPDRPVARLAPSGGARPRRRSDDRPIAMPIPGPGMPREAPDRYAFLFWLVPAAVPVLTILAILLGAMWR
jgi:hypothetical protein